MAPRYRGVLSPPHAGAPVAAAQVSVPTAVEPWRSPDASPGATPWKGWMPAARSSSPTPVRESPPGAGPSRRRPSPGFVAHGFAPPVLRGLWSLSGGPTLPPNPAVRGARPGARPVITTPRLSAAARPPGAVSFLFEVEPPVPLRSDRQSLPRSSPNSGSTSAMPTTDPGTGATSPASAGSACVRRGRPAPRNWARRSLLIRDDAAAM